MDHYTRPPCPTCDEPGECIDPDGNVMRPGHVRPEAIHWSNWSQQPDVHLAHGEFTTPAWRDWRAEDGLPEGVYHADNGSLYTFNRESANCRRCLDNAIDPEAK